MKMSVLDRLLLLATGLLAAWQIAVGIDELATLPVIAYTVGFGVLLVAGLLLIILGFDVLESPIVVIISTIIPLSLSIGLVWDHLPAWRIPYLAFALAGFLLIIITRLLINKGKLPILVLTVVHAAAGLIIAILPVVLAIRGEVTPSFILVGVGGALIGLGGLLLAFLKTGRPILSRDTILKLLPILLLSMTAAFVLGFGGPGSL
jgi:hypothetical protein